MGVLSGYRYAMARNRSGSAAGDSGRSTGAGRRRFLRTIGAGAAATSLAGCVGSLGGGGGGGGGGDGPIRIGGFYLLSGIAEALGASSRASAELAVKQVNENGGINGRDVEIVFRDHGDNPSNTITSLVQEEQVEKETHEGFSQFQTNDLVETGDSILSPSSRHSPTAGDLGHVGDPTLATEAKGEELHEYIVANAVAFIEELRAHRASE
ncbi:hypothetical protein BRD01_12345 [Halobacteriales archaeon QS_8_65_32]|nr:MAG: hypothetical protein BRD01_12345 [Halobacteriales archaeon QS_8_65_32]